MTKSIDDLWQRAIPALIFCGAFLCASRSPLQADQNVTLAWAPSISTDVVGYRIYYGTTSGDYTGLFDIGNTNAVTISRLVDGVTYYFAATSIDGAGNESPFSNEAVYTVPTAAAALTVSPATDGTFSFNVSGMAGYQYIVQISTNLLDWVSVQTNTAPFVFTEPNAADFSQCFYRAIYFTPTTLRSPSPKLTTPN